MSTWQEVLKAQHDDLDRLEAMDAALNTETTELEVDKVLKKPSNISFSASVTRKGRGYVNRSVLDDLDMNQVENDSLSPRGSMESGGLRSSGDREIEREIRRSHEKKPSIAESGMALDTETVLGDRRGPLSPGLQSPPAAAVDTNMRFNKARAVQLQKQLNESEDIRLKLMEQTKDLERQLKSEREEGKKNKKQITLLETEQRRNARKTSTHSASNADPAAMRQEIDILRKDLQTAERLVKQAESNVKSKDLQLKRASENISKMKARVSELETQRSGDVAGDRERADAAESRVKVLEKQRSDLIAAFKKQIKLIDVLKRQKLHIEAARLLSFTEEDFMKALDWNI